MPSFIVWCIASSLFHAGLADGVCGSQTDACMNEANHAECRAFEDAGCQDIMVMESCPLQFSCADSSSVCGSPADACMNEDNYLECRAIEDAGCQNILVMESCPVQFSCNSDSSQASIDQSSSSSSGSVSASNAPEIVTSCVDDCECERKDVGNCCGSYMSCVNRNFLPDLAGMAAWCASSGMMGICGFSTGPCKCEAGECIDGSPTLTCSAEDPPANIPVTQNPSAPSTSTSTARPTANNGTPAAQFSSSFGGDGHKVGWAYAVLLLGLVILLR